MLELLNYHGSRLKVTKKEYNLLFGKTLETIETVFMKRFKLASRWVKKRLQVTTFVIGHFNTLKLK